MDELIKKARNFFIIGEIAERLGMYSESASNYFKSLSAINDFLLAKINIRVKNHSERFAKLKTNFPEMYNITDKLFVTYRRTYTQGLDKKETEILRKKVEEAFENAKISRPTIEEIEEHAKTFFKK